MPNWPEILNEIGNVDSGLRSQSASDQVFCSGQKIVIVVWPL